MIIGGFDGGFRHGFGTDGGVLFRLGGEFGGILRQSRNKADQQAEQWTEQC
jgi:hypothetical protein